MSLARKQPGLVAAALLLSLSSSAFSQERQSIGTLDSRLSRVERVLDQSLLNQLQRVDALQREIRALRGEIESLNNELNTVKKRNTDLYNDTDRRITELESVNDALLEDGLSGFGGGSGLDETAISPSIADETVGGSQGVFVSESSARRGNDLVDFGDGPAPPRGPLRDTATQAEKASYTRAYDLLARGQNDSAVAAFDGFLKQYPDGPFSDNAWYWQGEAMYAERAFDDAMKNFGVVVGSFPNSTKVPDARLKIGFALYEQKNYREARVILTGVQDDYPGRSAAVLARKRLQQMDREGR